MSLFSLFKILIHSEICQISKMGHYSIWIALWAKYFYVLKKISLMKACCFAMR